MIAGTGWRDGEAVEEAGAGEGCVPVPERAVRGPPLLYPANRRPPTQRSRSIATQSASIPSTTRGEGRPSAREDT